MHKATFRWRTEKDTDQILKAKISSIIYTEKTKVMTTYVEKAQFNTAYWILFICYGWGLQMQYKNIFFSKIYTYKNYLYNIYTAVI